MKTIGIICEYNPFHLGHKKQLNLIRSIAGEDCAIVCLMSGCFVQRGAPAVFDKSLRAQAAIVSGADLVLELPVPYALSSAEGFAAGGVKILSGFCDGLCFGTETGTVEHLMATADALLSPGFSPALRTALESGASFPAARASALESMGCDASLLRNPNDILAVEYCKAIISQGCSMEPLPITRRGNYHDGTPDPENPSATALRSLILSGAPWQEFVPPAAGEVFQSAVIHGLQFGERAVLARLRTMSDRDFQALPYGSEGLWRKLMHACRSCAVLEEIIAATKSKRYTRTRIDRMILCAYLGITGEDLLSDPPYVRVLGFNDRGRAVLKQARTGGAFPHTGDIMDSPYQLAEQRWDDLYSLFAKDSPLRAGITSLRRVYIHKKPTAK